MTKNVLPSPPAQPDITIHRMNSSIFISIAHRHLADHSFWAFYFSKWRNLMQENFAASPADGYNCTELWQECGWNGRLVGPNATTWRNNDAIDCWRGCGADFDMLTTAKRWNSVQIPCPDDPPWCMNASRRLCVGRWRPSRCDNPHNFWCIHVEIVVKQFLHTFGGLIAQKLGRSVVCWYKFFNFQRFDMDADIRSGVFALLERTETAHTHSILSSFILESGFG